jgi:CheY-like chemotaxis protein
MTNHTILNLFELLSNEARNVLHSTLGMLDACDDSVAWIEREKDTGHNRQNVDKLLRLVDDMRELFAEPEPVGASGEFDVCLRLGEVIELLNLARRNRDSRLVWHTVPQSLSIRQDIGAFERALTPILDLTLKMARHGSVRIKLDGLDHEGIHLNITPPNSDLAEQTAGWLSSEVDRVEFKHSDDIGFCVALLVAGKRWRAMGGTARLAADPCDPPSLELTLTSLTRDQNDGWRSPAPPESLRVLVAEDSEDAYALAEVLMKSESLERAKTGLEAIDLVKEHRFDVIFMDVHMPGMDGYGAIRAIREWETHTAHARTPIVVLSSDEISTQTRHAAEAGCSGFLRKPVRPRDMFDLLDRLRAARSPAY